MPDITQTMGFNAVELAIITKMRNSTNKWFTANKLAGETKIAWETANKSLESLFNKGYLVIGKKKDRIYWKLYEDEDQAIQSKKICSKLEVSKPESDTSNSFL